MTFLTNVKLQMLGAPNRRAAKFDFYIAPKDVNYKEWTGGERPYSIPIRFTQLTTYMEKAKTLREWCEETAEAEEPIVERIHNTTAQDTFCCRLRFMNYHGYFQFKMRWT